jgi:hypothetical protein
MEGGGGGSPDCCGCRCCCWPEDPGSWRQGAEELPLRAGGPRNPSAAAAAAIAPWLPATPGASTGPGAAAGRGGGGGARGLAAPPRSCSRGSPASLHAIHNTEQCHTLFFPTRPNLSSTNLHQKLEDQQDSDNDYNSTNAAQLCSFLGHVLLHKAMDMEGRDLKPSPPLTCHTGWALRSRPPPHCPPPHCHPAGSHAPPRGMPPSLG